VSATYRIELHKDGDYVYPWKANIYRLSDDMHVSSQVGETRDAALGDARAYIARDNAAPEPSTVHVDDQGRDAEAPQSVKVP
jgi:hypothetical protein